MPTALTTILASPEEKQKPAFLYTSHELARKEVKYKELFSLFSCPSKQTYALYP
jgi:hypothetical protein